MMRLYRVAPLPDPELLIAASTTSEAADIFVTYSAATRGIHASKLVIEQFDRLVPQDLRPGLEDMLLRGVAGIARRNDDAGWSVTPLD